MALRNLELHTRNDDDEASNAEPRHWTRNTFICAKCNQWYEINAKLAKEIF